MARDIRAGRAYVELGVDDKLAAGLRAAQQTLKRFGAEVTAAGLKMTALGGAATGGLFLAAKSFADVGDSLDEMSARTGVSVERLSELQYGAKLAGLEAEALEGALRRGQRTITAAADGSGEAAEALTALGLSVSALVAMRPDEQFTSIGLAINSIEDPARRVSAAMQVFGKAGASVLPLFSGGAAGIAEFTKRARELNLVMSTEAARSAAKLADGFDDLAMSSHRVVQIIGESLAPYLTSTLRVMSGLTTATGRFLQSNEGLVVGVGAAAVAIGAAGVGLLGLGASLQVAGFAFGGLASAIGLAKLGLFALVSPLGLVGSAIGGLVIYSGAGRAALQSLASGFTGLRDIATDALGSIRDALASGNLGLAGAVAMAGLRVVWIQGMDALSSAWAAGLGKMLEFLSDFARTVGLRFVDVMKNIQLASLAVTSSLGQAHASATQQTSTTIVKAGFAAANVWEAAGAAAERAWISAMERIGSITTAKADEMREALTKRLADSLAERTKVAVDTVIDLASTGDDRRAAIEDSAARVRAEIIRDAEAQQRSMMESWARAIAERGIGSEAAAEASRDLKKAMDDLRAAIEAAKSAPAKELPRIGSVGPTVDDIRLAGATAVARTAASGSFSGALASQIAGSSTAASTIPSKLDRLGNTMDAIGRQVAAVISKMDGLTA